MISGGGLFGPSLTGERMAAVVSDQAWLRALLRFESALAAAEAEAGLIPTDAATGIAAAARSGGFDLDQIGLEARASANPVVPLLAALRGAAGEAGQHLHHGATSQDALDTAMMLIAAEALAVLESDLRALAGICAKLAAAHRDAVMPGRTLLQQAVPITFGFKAAGWLTALADCHRALAAYRRDRLAVQLGGAAGNLAALGPHGLEVRARLAAALKLAEPAGTWHADRTRIVELGGLLAAVGGAAGKIALDVVLLSQSEVGEVAEAAPGGSSAMAHKQNPVAAIEADACVRSLQAQVSVLLGAQRVEHERAAGAWQAEWTAVSNSFLLAGGALARTLESLSGLRVDAGRMRANLLAGGPALDPGSDLGLTGRLIDLALDNHRKEFS